MIFRKIILKSEGSKINQIISESRAKTYETNVTWRLCANTQDLQILFFGYITVKQ